MRIVELINTTPIALFRGHTAAITLGGLVYMLLATSAFADQHIDIMEAWARATPPGATVGASYFVVHNKGPEVDILLRIESPIADKTQMHTSTMHGELMKMEKLESVVSSTDSPLIFEPGGHHVMLSGLNEPLREGDSFPLTLVFEKAGPVAVMIVVRGVGAMGYEQAGEMHHDHTQNSE